MNMKQLGFVLAILWGSRGVKPTQTRAHTHEPERTAMLCYVRSSMCRKRKTHTLYHRYTYVHHYITDPGYPTKNLAA